ncbi:hypothetical protein CDAR_406731 [Caerostris darwini]|uniref:Uncharacterized protein n=1 Tax=Caerostris darwini TaxID=1538125 RepID=A0AAV4RAR1_9ARAC|nr:hypothetical protein CDAR_406731 [Caerostris darwini]
MRNLTLCLHPTAHGISFLHPELTPSAYESVQPLTIHNIPHLWENSKNLAQSEQPIIIRQQPTPFSEEEKYRLKYQDGELQQCRTPIYNWLPTRSFLYTSPQATLYTYYSVSRNPPKANVDPRS